MNNYPHASREIELRKQIEHLRLAIRIMRHTREHMPEWLDACDAAVALEWNAAQKVPDTFAGWNGLRDAGRRELVNESLRFEVSRPNKLQVGDLQNLIFSCRQVEDLPRI